MERRSHNATNPALCAGFTLLELLIVITMMIFIASIAVMNYFGAMRVSGYSSVSNNVFNALLMARQRACLDNKPVCFRLLSNTNYVVLEAIGSVTYINPHDPDQTYPGSQVFYDQYGDISSYDMTKPLLNMDRPGSVATVWMAGIVGAMPKTYYDANGVQTNTTAPAFEFHLVPTGPWNVGDRYSAEVFAPQTLARGFVFVTAPSNNVAFLPDGTVDANGLLSVAVKELINSNQIVFTISANGTITQGH